MAELSFQLAGIVGNTSSVHDSALNTVGQVAYNPATGDKFIYLKGVASTVATDFVTYDELGATTRLLTGQVGPLAVAMAAVVANKYGWYQIGGSAQANTGTIADNAALYATATAGRADDLPTVGGVNQLQGVTARSTVTANVSTVQLDNPRIGVAAAPTVVEYAADGAIAVTPHMAVLSKAGVGAYTIAAPSYDGVIIDVVNTTSNAHVITGTNLFWAGVTGGPFNKVTATAFPGGTARLLGMGGLWHVMGAGVGAPTVGD